MLSIHKANNNPIWTNEQAILKHSDVQQSSPPQIIWTIQIQDSRSAQSILKQNKY